MQCRTVWQLGVQIEITCKTEALTHQLLKFLANVGIKPKSAGEVAWMFPLHTGQVAQEPCFCASKRAKHGEQTTKCCHGKNNTSRLASVHSMHLLADLAALLASCNLSFTLELFTRLRIDLENLRNELRTFGLSQEMLVRKV